VKRTLGVVLVLGVLACGGEKAPNAEPITPVKTGASGRAAEADSARTSELDSLMARVIPAVAVTLAVQAKPERADSILAENGFTPARFEATLYTIAADSAASQLFEAALGH
jgi:hypothetical protein